MKVKLICFMSRYPEWLPEQHKVLQKHSFLVDKMRFESEDTYSFLLFGGGALLTLWLASAVVGAIDSIPVFPKLLEIVGLGYTVWFASRYLIFKKRREELIACINYFTFIPCSLSFFSNVNTNCEFN
ncbi:protein CURVATURE THYLAKOID 1D, chloroplastic-like [Humulus lupulus]|uniref:protein CURVATURE THYLAKOID 1D, chloroplastic-like n=1 Tax=Humulus lupulus TaxID=3486 RepID=UPI002B417283|nr:protein CURVATURE THYLAKOID 1D, chloroplastic-like [Humulus lupulus]